MKNRFGWTRRLVRPLLGLCASSALGFLAFESSAQITLIDFENIPPTSAPVDSFGGLLPGVGLSSSNQWVADAVCNSCFSNIQGRAISAFPDGSALLSISFGGLARDVRMDFGSGILGHTLTIGVSGYRDDQLVFNDSFVTKPVAGGADEVRASTFGWVDRIVIARTDGDTSLILDNLSFFAVPRRLKIELVDRTFAELTWATNFTDHIVEYTANLPASVWQPVTNSVAIKDDRFLITVEIVAPQRVYRLRKP